MFCACGNQPCGYPPPRALIHWTVDTHVFLLYCKGTWSRPIHQRETDLSIYILLRDGCIFSREVHSRCVNCRHHGKKMTKQRLIQNVRNCSNLLTIFDRIVSCLWIWTGWESFYFSSYFPLLQRIPPCMYHTPPTLIGIMAAVHRPGSAHIARVFTPIRWARRDRCCGG